MEQVPVGGRHPPPHDYDSYFFFFLAAFFFFAIEVVTSFLGEMTSRLATSAYPSWWPSSCHPS
jgi:hypothetical protein